MSALKSATVQQYTKEKDYFHDVNISMFPDTLN